MSENDQLSENWFSSEKNKQAFQLAHAKKKKKNPKNTLQSKIPKEPVLILMVHMVLTASAAAQIIILFFCCIKIDMETDTVDVV